ncbi:MAG: hypothetical protein JWP97_972 [Labilithrix sp.]|nr:hypothetical protein [Labilithrix sp.]
MNSSVEMPIASEPKKKIGAHPRIFALASLVALAAGAAALAQGVYRAATDSWMAPITLSADNDQILQINVKLNEQVVQRDKLKADIERIDADIVGIDLAFARLQTIEQGAKESLRWTAFTTNAQNAAMTERLHSLQSQKTLLEDMLARQASIAEHTQQNAAAGLVMKQEVDREVQLTDQLRLAVTQNARDTSDARMQTQQFSATSSVVKDAMENKARSGNGLLPEIAMGQERQVHLELEMIKLQAEKRALLADRKIFAESLDRMEEIFKQLRARPVYKAIEAQTDIAFVPYTQMAGLKAGDALISCKWILFSCQNVGRIAEVVNGEVVANDPWSDISRGQYVILNLTDREAAKEKVIRARSAR